MRTPTITEMFRVLDAEGDRPDQSFLDWWIAAMGEVIDLTYEEGDGRVANRV